jgi:hypothetical protein
MTALDNIAKIGVYVETYLAIPNPTDVQKARLRTDLATLAADIKAALTASIAAPTTTTNAAPVTTGNPNLGPVPSGLTNYSAAELDAGFVFQASLGNTTGADTNPAPGAAAALGFCGVVGTSDGPGPIYGIFKDGKLVGSERVPPVDGWGIAFGLAPGFNNDGPYAVSGAVRP